MKSIQRLFWCISRNFYLCGSRSIFDSITSMDFPKFLYDLSSSENKRKIESFEHTYNTHKLHILLENTKQQSLIEPHGSNKLNYLNSNSMITDLRRMRKKYSPNALRKCVLKRRTFLSKHVFLLPNRGRC